MKATEQNLLVSIIEAGCNFSILWSIKNVSNPVHWLPLYSRAFEDGSGETSLTVVVQIKASGQCLHPFSGELAVPFPNLNIMEAVLSMKTKLFSWITCIRRMIILRPDIEHRSCAMELGECPEVRKEC